MTARVLIVDDILANVKLLEAKLTADYFDAFTAMSGPEALETARRVNPDIILLDVMMPGMDGFEVCRRLKSNPQTHHIPVIMVTALDQPKDRVAGIEAGADMIFPEAINTLAQYQEFRVAIDVPFLANITEFGKTPLFSTQELGEIGVDIVLYCCGAYRAMNKGAMTFYEALINEGHQRNVIDDVCQVGQQLGEVHATLAVLLEFPRAKIGRAHV